MKVQVFSENQISLNVMSCDTNLCEIICKICKSGEAIGHPDGLAVIGIFFSLSPTCGFAIFCFLQILNLFDFSPMWYFLSFWSNTKFSICLIPGTTLRWLRCFPPSAPLLLLPLLLLPFPRQSPFPGDSGHLYFC